MQVYTFSEARQQLSSLLEQANEYGEVQIKRRDGQTFIIRPLKYSKSPLDVSSVDLDISTKEIVKTIRKMREKDTE